MAFDRQVGFRVLSRTVPNRRFRLGYQLDQRELKLLLSFYSITKILTNSIYIRLKNRYTFSLLTLIIYYNYLIIINFIMLFFVFDYLIIIIFILKSSNLYF